MAAASLGAQGSTGTITGRVLDSASGQPLASTSVRVVGTGNGALSRDDGTFTIVSVPAGAQRVRASRIGFGPQARDLTVPRGGSVTVELRMAAQAAVLGDIVVTGYGTQRREAISGSVASVSGDQANVGAVTNVDQMIGARVAGVQITQNSGEPGSGVQLRIRGGTSLSASNDPLYVIDGVPLQNEDISPGAPGIGSINPQLGRNPLNSINPNDIEVITVLKDAAATAIYGSRGANGVILITTKKGTAGAGNLDYDTYVGYSRPSNTLGLATGDQYRTFVQSQVALYVQDSTGNVPRANWRGLAPSTLASLGTANTNWEDALTRSGMVTSHNLAFSGGSTQTQYRASLNYFNQKGVVLGNGIQRYQGRLNGTHDALSGRLRLSLNMSASRVNNQFAPIENGGGFLGGLFTNMVIYNPTFPVRNTSGQFYETGLGALDVRNPVAMAQQIQDDSPEDRLLGNVTGALSILSNLTAQTTMGVDNASTVRRTFAPIASPVGAAYGGFALQAERNLQNLNFQQLLTYTPRFGTNNDLEIVGGYEYTKLDNRGFGAQMQGFITDAFGVDNLAAGTQANSAVPTSYETESTLASFFGRANYGFKNKYFLTGVLRQDGSSRLAQGHRWETFPAISGSWRLSEESFFKGGRFSNLAIRAGWGKQGNQSVQPYQTQLLLRSDPGATYPFGGVLTTGLRAAQVGNPDLRWETATQTNLGIDYGLMNDRLTGTFEVYQKHTKDLLLDVSVPQPAVVSSRIENIGSLRNRGFEGSAEFQFLNSPRRTFAGGLVLTVERNKVLSLGDSGRIIQTGAVAGQGQSNQNSEILQAGLPIGTFYGPKFLGVNAAGQQTFACLAASAGCANGISINPTNADYQIIGNANPTFTLGLHNNGTFNSLDLSWLWRGEFGGNVFNNTALVYQAKSDVTQGRNFLAAALNMPDAITEPAKYSSRWIEDRTFVRLQNVTVGYNVAPRLTAGRATRLYVSGDNLLLFTHYSGYDPEVFTAYGGIATRGVDYLTYPRARTFTLGARVKF
ncbi:MAG: TonB-dependent outer membrane protein SusC/RagA [Gemmatimonadetes bacterium]|nr:TonB-dependent outer membrane protein SusC/RagA [Gemmatimonadota bacterium]